MHRLLIAASLAFFGTGTLAAHSALALQRETFPQEEKREKPDAKERAAKEVSVLRWDRADETRRKQLGERAPDRMAFAAR